VAKPFSIQSPENIAKDYGGNKQRIAQAMQLGVVDPTAGVLAGMFIDRMRSAQMQEQAPQATVAQQVMGGAPTAPAPAPSGGLGTAPQAMPQPAPPMAPAQPPMGMADGGLASLPIADTMFDEPTNGGFDDGYAGGGLVAFADGGGIDADALRRALRAQESSGDYGVLNREGSGAMGAYQFMPATARALAKRLGVEYRPDLMQGAKGRSKEGIAYQERLMDEQMKDILRFSKGDPKLAAAYHFAGPNRAGWQDKTAKYQSDILSRMGSEAPAAGLGATAPAADFEAQAPDILAGAGRIRDALMGNMSPQTKRREELIAQLEASQSPEARKKASDQNKWMALAQLGATIATTPGGLLQGFMQGVKQQLPQLMEGDKRARAEARADQEMLVRLEDKSNEEKQKIEMLALELAKAEAGMLSDERKLQLQYTIAKMDDATRRAVASASNYVSQWNTVFSNTMDYNKSLLGNQSSERIAGARAAAAAADPFGDSERPAGTGAPAQGGVSFGDLPQ
jgi:hypothetical protein